MIYYEVTLKVQPEIAPSYESWLKEHIKEMLEIDGFMGAKTYLAENPTHKEFVVLYEVESREKLQYYFENFASKMRGDGLKRFEGKFEASRRILVHRK